MLFPALLHARQAFVVAHLQPPRSCSSEGVSSSSLSVSVPCLQLSVLGIYSVLVSMFKCIVCRFCVVIEPSFLLARSPVSLSLPPGFPSKSLPCYSVFLSLALSLYISLSSCLFISLSPCLLVSAERQSNGLYVCHLLLRSCSFFVLVSCLASYPSSANTAPPFSVSLDPPHILSISSLLPKSEPCPCWRLKGA